MVGLFCPDGLDAFVLQHGFRVFARGEVEEAFDGGEPLVPGGSAVVAVVFEVVEEVEDGFGVEHFHAELFGLLVVFFAEVLDEQAQAVAVGGDGVLRCAAFVGEIGDEKAGDEMAEAWVHWFSSLGWMKRPWILLDASSRVVASMWM